MGQISPRTTQTKDGLEILLRTPQPEDAANLLACMRIVMGETRFLLTEPDEFDQTVEKEAEMLKSALEHPDRIWIVPEVDGRIIGALNFAAGRRRRISHGGSFGISLLKEFHGRGIGSALLQALLDWAQESPRLEFIRLEVHARNQHARGLYEKLGFKEEGRQIRGVKFSDGTYDDILSMALPLRDVEIQNQLMSLGL